VVRFGREEKFNFKGKSRYRNIIYDVAVGGVKWDFLQTNTRASLERKRLF
jgi:hypothetical protein